MCTKITFPSSDMLLFNYDETPPLNDSRRYVANYNKIHRFI